MKSLGSANDTEELKWLMCDCKMSPGQKHWQAC